MNAPIRALTRTEQTLGLVGWLAGRAKAWSFQSGAAAQRTASRPVYHAWYVALWVVIPVRFLAQQDGPLRSALWPSRPDAQA